jgi:hypothetical protein
MAENARERLGVFSQYECIDLPITVVVTGTYMGLCALDYGIRTLGSAAESVGLKRKSREPSRRLVDVID